MGVVQSVCWSLLRLLKYLFSLNVIDNYLNNSLRPTKDGYNFANKEHRPFDNCDRWRAVERPLILANHQTDSESDARLQPS